MSDIDWNKVLRIPTAAELKAYEDQQLSKKGQVIKTYRGYDIVRIHETDYEVWKGSFKVTSCGSAWSCGCYIDERLSP